MRIPIIIRGLVGLGLICGLEVARAAPELFIEATAPGQFRLSWPAVETGWSLEETSALEVGANWGLTPTLPVVSGEQQSVTLTAGDSQRFFRLRQATGFLLTVEATSPAAGESGVSVTRETVFRLSSPLAADTTLDTTMVQARAAGRTILSRVELSADRRRVTLYYTENLPAGARVQVSFGAPGLRDELGRLPDLAGTGQPGSTNVLIFETVNTAPLASTAVVGRVLASQPGPGGTDVPLQNVTVTLDGLEQTVRTVTGPDGSFQLRPVPPGRFFVNVDGRTATGSQWPNGAYYPVVGKGWEAVAGRSNNPAGGTGIIYLPLVAAGTLQPVSATETTRVGFPTEVIEADPRLAGVEIQVPANGLFADNGQRGGMVGLAPVASDRLPEPLPAGLTHALDISIQTSGPQNFSQPVPARFPNLPDPITGEKLPPGAKTALWSFNHDTGHWELQGSMTISEDGDFAVTDSGVGIRQAGWHGVSNGTTGGGGPGGPPPCSPGGLLAEGTSSCDPPPCDGGPEGAKQKQQECFAKGAACALKCYEECGTPERPESWLDVLGKSKDCAEAAACSKKCKDDAERCADQYFDCILHGGERLGRHVGRQAVEAEPPVIIEARRILVEIEASANLWLALNEIASRAPTYEQLSAADQVRARQLAEEILVFHGGQFPSAYFGAKARNFTQLVLNSRFADAVFPAGLGYYALEDLGNGLIRRGRTETRGYLNNVILRPNTPYRFSLLFGPALQLYRHDFVSGAAGQPTSIPYGQALSLSASDADGDGIPAEAEFILGTRADLKDSDADGISDLEELRNHTNPTDNQPPANGVVASLDTAGDAFDIAVQGTVGLVADGDAGVAVVDVTDPLRPSLLQQINTPGTARGVALSESAGVGLVADGPGGVVVLDSSAPGDVKVIVTHQPGGDFRAVTVNGALGIAGSTTGSILTLELTSGAEIGRFQLPNPANVEDLAVRDDVLYVWAAGKLHVYSLESEPPVWVRSVDGLVPGGNPDRRMRLTLGPRYAFAAYPDGIVVFDLTDPLQPVLKATNRTTQRGWKQLVPVSGSLAVAADGLNVIDQEPQDVSVYDLGAEGTALNFLSGFVTPGISRSLVVDRGLALVADGTAGLQVVNFLPADTAGEAPTVDLAASFSLAPAQIESGQPGRLMALADDDVYVREVQFFLNGVRVATDRSWPFDYRFTAPPLTAGVTTLKFFARAVDTAGNATDTPETTVALLPDTTPPRVLFAVPGADSVVSEAVNVLGRFNEPVDFTTVSGLTIDLWSAGPDLTMGTSDDSAVAGVVTYDGPALTAVFEPAGSLPPGRYELTIEGVKDLAGNRMAAPFRQGFWVAPGGPEGDPDGDGLSNAEESRANTSPFAEDTDGDGWADEVEVHDGTNPRDPADRPALTFVARPPAQVQLIDPAELDFEISRPVVARPPVQLLVADANETGAGPWVAHPPVELWHSPETETLVVSPVMARPPLILVRQPDDEVGPPGPRVGKPPVLLKISAP